MNRDSDHSSEAASSITPVELDKNSLREIAALFLKLGFTAFGGPAAHIAMMEDEVVTRRGWMTRAAFLDLVGAINLIPGPNSTELAIHIGKLRGGWPGLLIAGLCFICPAVLIVLCLASLYALCGTVPQAQGVLRGVQPVVIAIIFQALIKFWPTAVKNRLTLAFALIAFLAVFARDFGFAINETVIVFAATFVGLAIGLCNTRFQEKKSEDGNEQALGLIFLTPAIALAPNAAGLFWIFLKIGSILYGSGYVLVAFLRSDLVETLGWISDKQLLDAVAIGQITPGPVFTSATFVGYQVAGIGGALAATLGIFLPSFVFVALLSVVMEKLQHSVVMRSFLDTVNAASFALMAAVCLQMARFTLWPVILNLLPIVIFVVSLALLLRTKINSVWLLAGGALCGWFFLVAPTR